MNLLSKREKKNIEKENFESKSKNVKQKPMKNLLRIKALNKKKQVKYGIINITIMSLFFHFINIFFSSSKENKIYNLLPIQLIFIHRKFQFNCFYLNLF